MANAKKSESGEYGKNEPKVGIVNDCDVDYDEDEIDDDVIGLMKKLKSSQSFSPQNSEGSITVLRNDEADFDASVDTKSFQGGSMRIRTYNMVKLSLPKRPGNENISPCNKPPTPMKSSSMRLATNQSLTTITPQQEVFGLSSILARILEFDGSLAAYHKNYDLIEGYMNPYRRRRNQIPFKHRPGTNQLAFVNRKFHSLIIGPEGMKEWKKQARQEIQASKRIARKIMANSSNRFKNENPSPLAKIFAIVIRNDAIEFEYLLSKHVTSVQQGTSITIFNGNDIFGMALKEYVNGEYMDDDVDNVVTEGDARRMGLPRGHPFLKLVNCWQAREFYCTTLLVELAYNAIVYGAHDVLSVLSSKHNTLFSTVFGRKGGQTLLGAIVAHACSQPSCLEEVSQGIRTLMAKQRYGQEELHANQKGSHGNSLHLAAAKGDRDLVDALLEIGFDPTQRCDERAFSESKGERSEKLWYPEDWARNRGHKHIVKLLSRRRKQIQQQRRQMHRVLSETTAEGFLGNDENTADYQTLDYETVTANDTLTADYGSCSCDYDNSDYDSEYDTFEEGPTFEDKTSYADDESTEYDSIRHGRGIRHAD